MSRREIVIMSGMTALSIAVLAALGRFAPQITNDTAWYLELHGFPAMLQHPRSPLYGWLVAALDLGHGSFLAVPAFQIATYVAACWLLVMQLRQYGLSRAAALSLGAALLFSDALLMDAHLVHPELFAITCGICAVAGTVHLAGLRSRWWSWLLVGLGAGMSYIFRPSFLPLVAVLPVLFLFLRAIRGAALRWSRAAAICVVSALPFVGIASLRAVTVGDPNIVSFGGWVMSGMAVLMLSDDIVARLPDDVRPYATEVLAARRAAEESGRMIGIPPNSGGVRSYSSVALSYFDVLTRTHDDVLFNITLPTRGQSESWVAFNRRLTHFSVAVMLAAPGRYAMWVIGASGRMLGGSIVTNLPAMLAIIVVAVVWPWRLLAKNRVGVTPSSPLDFPVLVILALLWLVAGGVLTVMLHAAGTRFIETASMMVASGFIYWATLLVMSSRTAKRTSLAAAADSRSQSMLDRERRRTSVSA